MYYEFAEDKSGTMTEEEIVRAKRILAQRNERTRQSGLEADRCDPAFRSYYHPGSVRGKQIYRSYTSEELLDILSAYMEHHGHSPDWERIHHVYKLYLKERFQDLAQAKAKARVRQKALTQQAKWPPDWPERVSSSPLYEWLEEHGKAVNEEDKAVIETICVQARDGLPPDLSSPACLRLNKLCHIKKALEMMNIPALRKNELRYMTRYWEQGKTQQTPAETAAEK